VDRAARTIAGRVHRTPLLRSGTLSDQLGVDARFKAELFQRTGSFKVRGALTRIASLSEEEKRRGVITISAGNHAQAVAWARRAGARVVAVEPELSPALHEGLRAGRSVPVSPRSAADALSAPFAGDRCIALCAELGVESTLVSEDDLAEAFRWLYARMKLAC